MVVFGSWTVLTSAASLLLAKPLEEVWALIVVAVCVWAIPILFLASFYRYPQVRASVLALDFGIVTFFQVARIAGIAMLTLWAVGELAAPFAAVTGGIDVFIGLSSIFMAFVATQLRPFPRRWFRRWHALGLADFVIATPIAVLYSPSALGVLAGDGPTVREMFEFPLSFIPMAGVPLAASMHIIALLQLRHKAELETAMLLPDEAVS